MALIGGSIGIFVVVMAFMTWSATTGAWDLVPALVLGFVAGVINVLLFIYIMKYVGPRWWA